MPYALHSTRLRTLSADTAGKLNILGHDGYTLCMDCTQVGILKETNKVCLSSFLKSEDSRSLETKIGLEILSNLTNKTLEWSLADQEIGRLLILADLTESDGTRTVTVRLLDASCGWSGLAGSLKKKREVL